ncbi:hypothetical protein V1525DRAFT_40759 [Lipomyces kononenkoae]|uniref:Uncharacterized protein n=1 Tax=Lipomyces kononenkoae TaxID=34357 RepID=A0ACC3SSW9_LIPKO
MVSFSQLASHRRPVLHLYRALLHHANNLLKDSQIISPTTNQPLTSPITYTNSVFLRRTIRRRFRKNRGRISLVKCKALLDNAYAREQVLRLAARKHDPTALTKVHKLITQAVDHADYYNFSYRHNPPRGPVENAAYKDRQRKESYIRMWAPGVRFRIPGLSEGRVREIAYRFHVKRQQHLRDRKNRYKAYNVKFPRLSFYQNAFNLPIFTKPWVHSYALARFLNKLRLNRQSLLDQIMDARQAIAYAAYADLDETWTRDLTGLQLQEEPEEPHEDDKATFLHYGRQNLNLLNKQLEDAKKYSKDSRQKTLRQLEFAKLEQLRNNSKQFKQRWRLTPHDIEREASLLD